MRKWIPKTHIDENGRVCTKCETYFAWEFFPRNKNSSTGYAPCCCACHKKACDRVKIYSEKGAAETRWRNRVEYDGYSYEREKKLEKYRAKNAKLNAEESARVKACEYWRKKAKKGEIRDTYADTKHGVFAKYFTKKF